MTAFFIGLLTNFFIYVKLANMISNDTINALKWYVIKKAQASKQIHYLIFEPTAGTYKPVNSTNTVLTNGTIIYFIGFPYSDTKRLKLAGYLT